MFRGLLSLCLGVYECLAINDNGTALSEKINFQAAFIQLFEEMPIEVVRIEIGDPYAHNCTSPPSNPNARLFWILMVRLDFKFER